jgi:cell wall-associated NlpC family hydrolase
LRAPALVLTTIVACFAAAAPSALAQTSGATGGTDNSTTTTSTAADPASTAVPATDPGLATGGAAYGAPNPATTQLTPEQTATILPTGMAAAPQSAPDEVKAAIAAANEIIGKPYVYGGGHNLKFTGKGYDCSGTVSYALHGANMLKAPLDSSSFMKWGAKGAGLWFTIYTNPSHAFMVVAGLRLDTSAAGDPSGAKGPRWRPVLRSTKGFTARHPVGF